MEHIDNAPARVRRHRALRLASGLLACSFVAAHLAAIAPTASGPGGGGLRGPSSVPSGGTIDIEVASNDSEVEVSTPGPGAPTKYPVGPGRDVHIPVPGVPPGTIVMVTIGKGSRRRVHLVEVVDT